MNFLQLQYFYKIAHTPTLTQAAAELRISQPSLSKVIRSLEDEFGTRFFERSGRHIRLNERGTLLLQYATQLLDTAEALRAELQDCRAREDLSLRVGVFAASALFPAILTGFRAEHPNIKITIVQHSHEHTPNQSSLDLIFYASRSPAPPPGGVRLGEEEILLAVPRDHGLADRDRVPLGLLEGEPVLAMTKGKTLRGIVDAYCAEAGFVPNVVLESDDPAMLRNLIQSGFGVSFVPEKTWMTDRWAQIRLLHLTDPACVRYLYLTTPKGSYRSTAARLFQSYLVRYFSGSGWPQR